MAIPSRERAADPAAAEPAAAAAEVMAGLNKGFLVARLDGTGLGGALTGAAGATVFLTGFPRAADFAVDALGFADFLTCGAAGLTDFLLFLLITLITITVA